MLVAIKLCVIKLSENSAPKNLKTPNKAVTYSNVKALSHVVIQQKGFIFFIKY